LVGALQCPTSRIGAVITSSLRQYVYYRRTRRLDIPLITELQILPEGKQPSDMSSAWRQATRSLRDGVRGTSPVFLWYKAEKTRREMSDQEAQKIITEVDVLNGEDQPWYGFEMLEPPTTVSKPGRYESVHLLYRRGIKRRFLICFLSHSLS
jgi:hypothetical protein